MFSRRGFIFVFGGWGPYGPSGDLHVGRSEHPLALQRIPIAGRGPPCSYEMKVTVLEDLEHDQQKRIIVTPAPLRVAVTGGFLRGGYHQESGMFGILQICFPGVRSLSAASSLMEQGMASEQEQLLPEDEQASDSPLPTASWTYLGQMRPRSNHTATFIPPSAAGPRYLNGYVLLFGGTMSGHTVNNIDVLDLETFAWEADRVSEGEAPTPRNSHSATLLATPQGPRVLVAGGGTGDRSNGGPPRGGTDLADASWFDPRTFCWEQAADGVSGLGRGHMAFDLCGTAAILGGGRSPSLQCTAFGACASRRWDVEALAETGTVPQPRIFGGGCLLPDGTLLIFGGWHPWRGASDELWAAHVDGWVTPFCSSLRSGAQPIRRSKSNTFRENFCRDQPAASHLCSDAVSGIRSCASSACACLQQITSTAKQIVERAKLWCPRRYSDELFPQE